MNNMGFTINNCLIDTAWDSNVTSNQQDLLPFEPCKTALTNKLINIHRYQKIVCFLAFILLIVMLWVPAVHADDMQPFFSEYIEGSSYNKALEIYNPSNVAIDLAAGLYNIQFYFNGNATAGGDYLLNRNNPCKGYLRLSLSRHIQ